MPEGSEATDEAGDRAIPVQRMRPGDHAFTAYASDTDQWPIIDAFVRQGLIEGEKVVVFMDPQVTGDELLGRLEHRTPAVVNAWATGQLTLSSMRALIHPDRSFTAARQWQRLMEEADVAVRQGYPAMRAYIDMAWVADLGTKVDDVMWRERNAEHLFDGSIPYSEICAYDGRWFSTDVLDAMVRAHPRNLLESVGALRIVHGRPPAGADDGTTWLRLVGEADIGTSGLFQRALRSALDALLRAGNGHTTDRPPGLTVDLTSLHFLAVGCAADLLRLSAEAGGEARGGQTGRGGYGGHGGRSGRRRHPRGQPDRPGGERGERVRTPAAAPRTGRTGSPGGGTGAQESDPVTARGSAGGTGADGTGIGGGERAVSIRVTVNCTPFQARTLRRLGADSIRSLTLMVEEGHGC